MRYITFEEKKVYLSVRETANILGVCCATVYKIINSEELKAVKINNKTYRIKADDLLKYMEKN